MDCNITLNATCEFDGYLICKMPADMVEMELKIKTRRGKYTLHKDTNTRTERYHPWERVDKRSKIHTRRSKGEVDSKVTTSSETDIQMGKGFAYPSKIFTNPEFAKAVPLSDTDCDVIGVEVANPNFIGEFVQSAVQNITDVGVLSLIGRMTQ